MTHPSTFTTQLRKLRKDLLVIVRRGIDGASPTQALGAALTDSRFRIAVERPLHVVAAGKAAGSMAAALVDDQTLAIQTLMAVGTHAPARLPARVEWHEAAHPLPDERSVRAGQRAQAIASRVSPDETLLLLLSGGASALLAVPADGIGLDDKRRSIDVMMRSGADIQALNTVRKHLSGIKGGQLAAATRGLTLTLAVSDVMDDDVSVIGSGPGVPDPTTWLDVAAALDRHGGRSHPAAVRQRVDAGRASSVPDTPKRGDPRMSRSSGHVIASRKDAVAGAERAASALGYTTVVLPEPITGEAREAALGWYETVGNIAATTDGPLCVISAGETTVHVKGGGRGGRNQEFALAIAHAMHGPEADAVAASLGTDGIDGPTDAAGAIVDRTTIARAATLSLDAAAHLAANDSFAFFEPLGDLIRTGRTDTNVGDLQVYLRG